MIHPSGLTAEEKQFLSRIGDMFALSQEKYQTKFSRFLTEGQAELVHWLARQQGYADYRLFGGYAQAQRMMLATFPPYQEPEDTDYPLCGIHISYKKNDSLSHRDFLGSLMGLMLTREAVGDILVGEGTCVVFVLQAAAQTVLTELKKVGNVGVCCQLSQMQELPVSQAFSDIGGTVSSLRLDSVVALVTRLSRGKSAELIRAGLVRRNGLGETSVSRECVCGDTLSIQGHGKYKVDDIGGISKKGRIHLQCKKYL